MPVLFGGDTWEQWSTPLSSEGYKWFFVTHGEWKKGTYSIPLACSRDNEIWEHWMCIASQVIWLRVISDEEYDLEIMPTLASGTSRAPFFRVLGSVYPSVYEDRIRLMYPDNDSPIQELFIASMEHSIHLLVKQEPSFQRLTN